MVNTQYLPYFDFFQINSLALKRNDDVCCVVFFCIVLIHQLQ